MTVDTRSDPGSLAKHKAHWVQVVKERVLGAHEEDSTSYNVLTCSEEDWHKIQQLHRTYFENVRAIVAASKPNQVLALVQVNLVHWKV